SVETDILTKVDRYHMSVNTCRLLHISHNVPVITKWADIYNMPAQHGKAATTQRNSSLRLSKWQAIKRNHQGPPLTVQNIMITVQIIMSGRDHATHPGQSHSTNHSPRRTTPPPPAANITNFLQNPEFIQGLSSLIARAMPRNSSTMPLTTNPTEHPNHIHHDHETHYLGSHLPHAGSGQTHGLSLLLLGSGPAAETAAEVAVGAAAAPGLSPGNQRPCVPPSCSSSKSSDTLSTVPREPGHSCHRVAELSKPAVLADGHHVHHSLHSCSVGSSSCLRTFSYRHYRTAGQKAADEQLVVPGL
ncbi:Unknown protein, partial [Striga hermonthica]